MRPLTTAQRGKIENLGLTKGVGLSVAASAILDALLSGTPGWGHIVAVCLGLVIALWSENRLRHLE